MGDQDGGLAGTGLLQIFQNGALCFGIDGADAVVEDQDRRILHQSTGNGDTLLLTAGDGNATLAQNGAIALLEFFDITVDVCQLCSRNHRTFVVCGNTEGNVVFDGIGEQEVILRNVGASFPDAADGKGIDILTVDKQGAIVNVVSTQDQIHQCGLTGTGLTYQTHAFAGLDGKGNVLQCGKLAVRVLEIQVAEFDITLGICQFGDIFPILNMNGGVQQFTQTSQRCLAAGRHIDQLGNGHDGPNNRVEIADEFQQSAGVEGALVHQIAAVAQNDADDAFHKEHDHDAEQHGCLGVSHIGFFVFHIQLFEGPQFLSLLDKGLDHSDAGEAFLGEIGQTGIGLLTGIPFLCQPLTNDGGGCQQKCHGNQGKQGQARIHAPHFADGHDAQHYCIEEHHHTPAEAFLHRIQVVGEQTHQIANFVDLIILPA